MATAEADLVVSPGALGQAFADLIVSPGIPAGATRATADLVVTPTLATGARAYGELVVSPPLPVNGRAFADLVVRGRVTMPLYRRVAGLLEPMDVHYRRNGSLVVCNLYRRVNGQLVPQAGTGTNLLAATAITVTPGNGQVLVSWTAVAGATGYKVGRNGIGSTGVGPTETTEAATARTKLFANLTNGTAYTFSVQPLVDGPIAQITATPSQSAQGTGLVKPLMGIGGGPEPQQFTPLNVNTNPDRQIGPMLVRRSYDGALPSSFAASAAASDVAAGRVSAWSWKPTPNTFLSSPSQQAAFSAFLDTIPLNHKVRIIAQHEPENGMSSLGGVAAWCALQNKVADLVHQKNRPNLTFGPCWMGSDTWATTSSYYSQWINGPAGNNFVDLIDFDKMDFLGIDPYKTSTNSYTFERISTVNNNGAGTGGSALSMMAWLAQFDLPISIMEWGFFSKQPDNPDGTAHSNSQPPVNPHPDGTVATFITEGYDWFKRWNAAHPPRIEGGKVRGSTIDLVCWFNYTLMGSDNPISGWLVSPGPWNTPLKLAAYKQTIADSKLGGTGVAPVANFTGSPASGAAPLTVQFTSTSTGAPTSYLWQFGDGTTSTAQNPIKTFTGGSYTVTLTATNPTGSSVFSRINYVTVTAPETTYGTGTYGSGAYGS